jgi:PST family polysaccharide transporter
MPVVFGSEWERALDVYPFIALGYLVNATFNMHSSVLYVLRRNRAVAAANLAHVALFVSATLLLVPRMGLTGYGIAEVIAMLGYLVIHVQVRRLFHFSYDRVQLWLLAFAPPLFVPLVSLPWGIALWLPLLIVATMPPRRRQLREYAGYLRLRSA